MQRSGINLKRGAGRFGRHRMTVYGVIFCISNPIALIAHPGLHHDIERATAALEKSPENPSLLVERGFYYRLDGNLDASLKDLNRAVEIAPDSKDAYAHRGLALSMMGRKKEAESDIDKFISLGGATAAVYSERARIRAADGRLDEAIKDFNTAISLDVDVDLVLERGRLLESLGRSEAAAEGYRSAIRALGGAIVLREALIRVEVGRGNFDLALAQIDAQLEVSPVKTEGLLQRAEVLEMAGHDNEAKKDRESALAEAQRVLAKRPSSIHLLSRAKALASLGRRDEAIRDLQLAVSKAPRFAEGKKFLEELESISPKTARAEGSGESVNVR